jgi:hypothetical protein
MSKVSVVNPLNFVHERACVSTTDVRVHQVRRVLWNPSACQAGLVRPVVCILRLPRPLDPARTLFIGDDLRFPVLTEEGLVSRAER